MSPDSLTWHVMLQEVPASVLLSLCPEQLPDLLLVAANTPHGSGLRRMLWLMQRHVMQLMKMLHGPQAVKKKKPLQPQHKQQAEHLEQQLQLMKAQLTAEVVDRLLLTAVHAHDSSHLLQTVDELSFLTAWGKLPASALKLLCSRAVRLPGKDAAALAHCVLRCEWRGGQHLDGEVVTRMLGMAVEAECEEVLHVVCRLSGTQQLDSEAAAALTEVAIHSSPASATLSCSR
jgi:hypothetical protein